MRQIYIHSIGVAVPRNRLKLSDVYDVWENLPEAVYKRMRIDARAVIDPDEDPITLGVDAARRTCGTGALTDIGAIFFGSQTGPYLGRSSAAILSDMLGANRDVFAADVQFSGKSGTAALAAAAAFVRAGFCDHALAIGADVLGVHAAPGDPFEYSAAAGAGAILVSSQPGMAEIQHLASVSSDTGDAYRVDGERYVRTGGAVMNNTGVGLPEHTATAFSTLIRKAGINKSSIDRVAFGQSTPGDATRLAAACGLEKSAFSNGTVSDLIGDAGAGAPIISLASVLSSAKAGEKLLLTAYGTGAGCDCFLLEVQSDRPGKPIDSLIKSDRYISYAQAIRFERRYHNHERSLGTYE